MGGERKGSWVPVYQKDGKLEQMANRSEQVRAGQLLAQVHKALGAVFHGHLWPQWPYGGAFTLDCLPHGYMLLTPESTPYLF